MTVVMQEKAAVAVPRPESKRRRGRIALALGVLAGWLVAIAIAIPFAARLSSVQQNDPTLFLPADAEATRVVKLQPQFRSDDVTPALIVYERAT
ncbi:MAG TPA: hypothetical protein VLS53_07330, partial [Candidatus Dormibacteraeota bacterium]|nr:hypothetical protein [Candidatus Dormibacteraeota bacterium]